jgi:hypothetical protein
MVYGVATNAYALLRCLQAVLAGGSRNTSHHSSLLETGVQSFAGATADLESVRIDGSTSRAICLPLCASSLEGERYHYRDRNGRVAIESVATHAIVPWPSLIFLERSGWENLLSTRFGVTFSR